MSTTPRTDLIAHRGLHESAYCSQMTGHARELETELAQAISNTSELLKRLELVDGENRALKESINSMEAVYRSDNEAHVERAYKAETELAQVREELADWRNAAAAVDANIHDEVHCGCVPILRKQLKDAKHELANEIAEGARIDEAYALAMEELNIQLAQAKVDLLEEHEESGTLFMRCEVLKDECVEVRKERDHWRGMYQELLGVEKEGLK